MMYHATNKIQFRGKIQSFEALYTSDEKRNVFLYNLMQVRCIFSLTDVCIADMLGYMEY